MVFEFAPSLGKGPWWPSCDDFFEIQAPGRSVMIEVRKYIDTRGRCPLDRWLCKVPDRAGQARIRTRIDDWPSVSRVIGNPSAKGFASCASPRVPAIVSTMHGTGRPSCSLLCGGDKSSQDRDIAAALAYWRDYRGQ